MSYIKGNFKKYIFRGDNGYVVGLFKVKETDIELSSKTVTFTGYFDELNEIDNYIFEGEIVNHQKYGTQFSTSSYEVLMPTEKEHIVEFLSSPLFKGIGEKKAEKIVDFLGTNCLEEILNDFDLLLTVKGVKEKDRDEIYYTLEDYKSSYEEVMNLTKIGFSMKDALMIKDLYKQNINIALDNPYSIIEEIPEVTFPKIEKIKTKLNISNDDLRRVCAGIVYTMENLSFRTGNTYTNHDELILYSKKVLLVNEEKIEEGILELIKDNKVLIYGDKYYLMDIFNSEKYIADRLGYLTGFYESKNYDKDLELLEKEFNCKFDSEQKKAITTALNNKISIITGGPGTGKTTIIKAITSLYQKINKLSDSKLIRDLTFLAPTGRASKRISDQTNLPSYTIHRFLKWQKESNTFMINEENKSNTKFVILDEASMLDNNLFYNLLLGLDENTKILLIGDYNQLPSVGAGQVLKDLIESDIIPVTYLKKIYRQEEGSNINLFASDIINNKIDFDIFNETPELTFVECTSSNLKQELKDFIITYKDMSIYDIEVLAPIYKKENGIDDLNSFIKSILNEKDIYKNEINLKETSFREKDKVIHLVNSVENNVFNGDIGEILRINSKKGEVIIDFDNNLVTYKKSNLENIRLAYTISIHKAQGSEFSIVIVPILNSYSTMLYKKLIYTAVTRAKQRLIILGEKQALEKAVLTDRDQSRKTSLKEFLIDSIN